MWFFLALISALLAGLRRAGEKRLLHQTNQFTLGWLVQAFSLPVLLLAIPLSGRLLNPFALGPSFWLPIVLEVLFFYPLNTWSAGKAMRHGELSKVLPVQSLGPLMSMVFGLVILHQVPSVLGVFAIFVICAGVYVLNMKGKTLHNPIHTFRDDRASLSMLLSTALVAAFVPVNVFAIKASNATTYAVVSTACAALMLLLISWRLHKVVVPSKKRLKPIFILGTLQGAVYSALVMALMTGPVAYISAIKSASVLIGALSGLIVLKEKLTQNKAAAFVLIACGLVLLAFS